MPHFFEKRDPWGNGLGLWVLVSMAFALPLAVWGVMHLRMENDVEHWLSDDNLQTRQFQWYNSNFASEDSLLLTWDDSSLEDPRVERLAQKISGTVGADGVRRGGLKQVESVRTPGQLIRRMVDLKIEREEAVRRVTGVLAGPGRVWCQFSTPALNQRTRSLRFLQDEARERFGLELQIVDSLAGIQDEPEPGIDEDVAEVSTSQPAVVAEAEVIEEAPAHDFQVSWRKMHAEPAKVTEFIAWAKQLRIPVAGQRDGEPLLTECFLHAGQPAALAIALSHAGQADRGGTLAHIRRLAEEAGVSPDTLHMGGSPVATAALNEEVLKGLWNPAAPWYLPHQRSVVGFSWLAGLILAFWLLRSVRLAVIVLAVSYFTTLITIALVPATGGSLSMVLIVMPALLLVITLSGAVQMVNHWKHAAVHDSRTAIMQSIITARKPCLMSAVALAIGLCTLLTSQLAPVRAFGFYSLIGTLLSAVAVLYAVPAMLQAWPAVPRPVTTVTRQPWTRLGRMIVRHSRAVTAVWLLASLVTMYGLRYFRTETKVVRYFPNDSRLVRDYDHLEEQLAGIVPVETVVSFGREAREELNFTQRLELVRAIEQKMRKLPDISGTLSLADFQPVAEPQPQSPSIKEKREFDSNARDIESGIRRDPRVRSLYLVSKADGEFSKPGDELWRITCQVPVMPRVDCQEVIRKLDEICRSETKYHADTGHVVTGQVPLLMATWQAVIDSLITSFFVACSLLAVVLAVVAGDLVAGLLSMLPIVLPVGIVFGATAWMGIPVDASILAAATVALGVAVQGTLHLITGYRNGVFAGISHRRAIVRSLEQNGPALWPTSVAIGFGMLMLSPAPLLLISRLGWLMGALILTALLASIVFTPALLAGPMGWPIHRSTRRQRGRLKAVTEDPNPGDRLRHGPHVTPPKPQIALDSRPDAGDQFELEPRESRQRKRRR